MPVVKRPEKKRMTMSGKIRVDLTPAQVQKLYALLRNVPVGDPDLPELFMTLRERMERYRIEDRLTLALTVPSIDFRFEEKEEDT